MPKGTYRRRGRRLLGKRRRPGAFRRRGYKRINRAVKRALARSEEYKYVYSFVDSTFDPNISAANYLPYGYTFNPTISQGSGVANRIGNEIHVKRVSFRGRLDVTAGNGGFSASTICPTRMIIGTFKAQPSSWPALDFANVLDIYSPFSQIDNQEFRPMMDKFFTLGCSGTSLNANTGLRSFKLLRFSQRFSRKWTFLLNNSNVQTTFNKFVNMFICSANAATEASYRIRGSWKLTYTE